MTQFQIGGISYADLVAELKEDETPDDYIHPEFNRPYTRQELTKARQEARDVRRRAAEDEENEERRLRHDEAEARAAERAEAEDAEDAFESGRKAALDFHIY